VDAHASGQRQRLVVPVLVPLGGEVTEAAAIAIPPAEPLPPPRKLPDAAPPPK
jgi:hypothetical protein